MKIARTFMILISGVWAFLYPASAQQMMSFTTQGEVFDLRELGALLGEEAGQVQALMVMPGSERAEVYREVDLQAGDVILFLNGKRIKAVKDFEQQYNALAVGDTVKIGLRRREERMIAAFTKADPKNLPERKMMKMMVGPDGSVTTASGEGGQKVVKTLDPDAAEITPLPVLGVVIGNVKGAVKILDKLPIPIKELEGVDLQTGDVLQSLNGQKITGVSQFTESFEKLAVGAKVELQYLRSDKTLTAAFNKPQTSGRVMIRTNDN